MTGGVISLKSSVFFSRFDEGVVFRGSEAPVVFRGKRAWDLVGALLDRMERGTTREQLIGGLPELVRPAADRLIGELERNALLRERQADDLAAESGLAGRFANLWSYLADHHARPGDVLAQWRGTQFVIDGAAEAAPYAARALAECAAERVRLVGSAAADGAALDAVRAEFPSLEVEIRPDMTVGAHDEIAIYAGGDRPFAPAGVSARDCWYFGLLRGHVAVAYSEGALAAAIPSWEAQMRPPLAGWEQARLSPQRVALAAAAMAFCAFNRHAGLGGEADWSRPHIVEPSSQITPLRLAGEVRVGAEAAEPVPDADATLFEEAIAPLFDAVTGIFEDVTDDLPQVPLSACRLRVFAQNRSELGAVLGWGTSLGEARRRAVARGLVTHLRTVPGIGDRAESIAVANTPAEAVAEAEAALAAVAGLHVALPQSALIDPDAVKLAKLFGLVTGEAPVLTGWSSEEGAAASVAVHLDGSVIGEASGTDLQAAAYRALGDACLAVQLPEISGAAAADSWAAPAAGAPVSNGGILVDPGFPSLAGQLFCAATGVAAR